MARKVADEFVRGVMERFERTIDPETPPEEVADLIAEQYGGAPVPYALVEKMLAEGSTPERLTEIAQIVLTASAGDAAEGGEPPSLTAVTFASLAARANGDLVQWRRLLDQALAAISEPEERLDLAQHLSATGHDAEAAELLEAGLREEPGDRGAADRYGALLGVIYERAHGEAPGECPCGQGTSWQDCCEPRERAVLARFADRTGLNALEDAVRAYARGSDFAPVIEEWQAEWLSGIDDLGWEQADRDWFGALAEETAWPAVARPEDGVGDAGSYAAWPAEVADEDDAGTEDEDDAATVMAAFAADASVPEQLAARAAAWRDHIHYGLWRVDDPQPAPGLWCTDIVSAVTRYAEFPPDATERMARWAAWLGALVPVDGVWRCTGRGMWLSPAEADAAAELVDEGYQAVFAAITGRPRQSLRRYGEPLRFGRAEPLGVYADAEEPATDVVVIVTSRVTAELLSRFVPEVRTHRTKPPGLRTTDGDEMCLITARITVDDGEQAAERLDRRTDFDRDPDEPERVVWYGRPVADGQHAAVAEVRASLRAQGLADPVVDEPERWLHGTLDVRGNEIVADVNSRERLARLLDILTRIGASPVVTDETQLDPRRDLAWPTPPSPFPEGAAPAAEGWEKQWLDEKVQALGGRTPRQAALGQERPLLEGLLRQAEYEGDLLAAQGKPGIDTVWLRNELDMADD